MTSSPHLDRSDLRPGMRVAVAVSGGADSVGLLCALSDVRSDVRSGAGSDIGLVLSVAHVHHGIRGAEADEDERFVAELAQRLGLAFHLHRVDTPASAREHNQSLEEAARALRYEWFRALLAAGTVDAVATAHTLDDQAETVLHRLLRGAWTEGLSGIHPVVTCPVGVILRPFLDTRRTDIVAWLKSVSQPWREDASNADTTFTRNRIRHEILPQLATFNPRIAEQMAHMAVLARDEESWWEAESQRLIPGLILPGRAVRGGGRAVSTHPGEGSLGMELERLRPLSSALRRRLLRAAAKQLRCALNFEQTERLMAMLQPDGPRREQLTAELRAERTARELRLVREAVATAKREIPAAFALPIPGEVAELGVALRTQLVAGHASPAAAVLRTPQPGDRVHLKYSRGPKPLKEVFERMHADPEARSTWPLVEWQGRIVWMKDVVLESDSEVPFAVEQIQSETARR